MTKVLAVLAVVGACAVVVNAQPEKKDTGRPSAPAATPASPARPSQPNDRQPADRKPTDKKPADMKQPEGMPEGAMPPGMTPELMKEMEACMIAAQPGPEHQHLQSMVGTWEGKNKMWMTPDAPPMETTSTARFASTLGGRYIHGDFKGPMPGMGMFEGAALYGYDNVSKKYQVVWVDNMGTGMMIGTGEASPDKKTLTWTMKWNHPTRGEVTFREVDTMISPDEMKLEMYGPHTDGKEFKMMEIVSKRVSKEQPKLHEDSHGGKPGAHHPAVPHTHSSPAPAQNPNPNKK
ncbi:MAG TPA: DUF1579 domain-containing protein [Phycisphaerales bacterium]|nr:DUF1579 domain-containing protein [Phycisphaerales bacterium]